MLPSYWLLEQVAKQKMREAEARAARRRLMPARTPLGTYLVRQGGAERRVGALRITDPADSSTSRWPGAVRGWLRPLFGWSHRS
jgi:hypothetical protein